MNEAVVKDQIIAYAQELIAPATIEGISLEDTISDQHGDTNVWLLESDMGEMFWVLEGEIGSNIYKKSGIYDSIQHVYNAYLDMLEEDEHKINGIDRFQYINE